MSTKWRMPGAIFISLWAITKEKALGLAKGYSFGHGE
jgi:hypothetical protein